MNLNYIDWYLVELRRRIHDVMPMEEENSFILETKNHLSALSEEFESQGMDPRSAQIAAIERFGSPDVIASDCLVGIRSRKERLLIRVAGVALAVLLVFAAMNQFMLVYLPTQTALVVVPLALFALILGKMPSWKWLGFYFGMTCLFGAVVGYQNTFASPYSSYSYMYEYNSLREHYRELHTSNSKYQAMEHQAAESWRSSIRTAKDLGKNDWIEVPRVTYVVGNGIVQYFPTAVMASSPAPRATYAEGINIMSKGSVGFQDVPSVSTLTLHGPLTAKDVRQALQGRLNEVESHSLGRDIAMSRIETALNTPVIQRVLKQYDRSLRCFILPILPLSLFACYICAKVRGRFRFKPGQMRLA